MRLKFLIPLVILISGCSIPQTRTPLPTLHIVRAGFSPSTVIWQDQLQTCVQSLPGTALGSYQYPDYISIIEPDRLDFFIQLGDKLPTSAYATQLGKVNIVWISHAGSSIHRLTYQQLADLYQGNASISESSGSIRSPKIDLWLYPIGSELAEFLFTQIRVPNQVIAAAYLAPDPEAMLQAVSENPQAIGYIPESWLQQNPIDLSVQEIQITSSQADDFIPEIQVFAVAPSEPKSLGRQALLCLKDQLSPSP